jgi:hypothetical protein
MRAAAGTRRVVTAGALAALGLAASGCRVERWGSRTERVGTGTDARSEEETKIEGPKRVGDADATAREGRSASFELDEKSGRPKPTLVLRLDYFPEARPGATNLPACLPPLAADTEVGVAACEQPKTEGGATVPVLAKNLDQDCYTDMRRERVSAKEPLVLKDCKRAFVAVAGFEPKIRVDVEVR